MTVRSTSFTGSWWLPEKPNRKLAGELTYDPADSLKLVLHNTLRATPQESGSSDTDLKRVSEALVHGVRHEDRKLVTLVGVSGADWQAPLLRVTNVFDVDLALIGDVPATADAFQRVSVEFDFLKAWTQPPSRVDFSEPHVAKMRTGRTEVAVCRLPDGSRLTLNTGVAGMYGDDGTDLVEHCYFQLESSEEMQGLQLLDRAVRPLHDLLMVSLGVSVRLRGSRLSYGEGRDLARFDALFPVAQRSEPDPAPTPARLAGSVLDYRTPTLLLASGAINGPSLLPTDELLMGWFREHHVAEEVLRNLLSPFYAPFMSPEHRYAATFQSAEALYGVLQLDTRDLAKDEHRERVRRVVDVLDRSELPPADGLWAKRVLSGRNDKSLPDKIDALLRNAGAAGRALLVAAPQFGTESARLRARISHAGAGVDADRRKRLIYKYSLRWIVRGHVLCRMLKEEEQSALLWESVAGREQFKNLVHLLTEARGQD